MPRDFTLAAFVDFCRRATAYPCFTLAGYLVNPAPPPPPFVIWRVDVDYREGHAIQLARLAAAHHLHGSFYFRCPHDHFPLDTMRVIAALGHEVGYHFETLDTCRGDMDAASDRFLRHIDLLRQQGFEIRTVAAHGSPPTTPAYGSNLDLLTRRPVLIQQAGLLGETTLSVDFECVTYVSDAGWRWRYYPHYQPGSAGQQATLSEVTETFAHWSTGLYINFHPQHWFVSPAQMLFFRWRQRLGKGLRRVVRKLDQRQ